MAQSIVIIGPQGVGKFLNGPALAEAYGLPHWIDAEEGVIPMQDHIILGHEVPRGAQGLKVVPFSEAIKKVPKPHPNTPRGAEGGLADDQPDHPRQLLSQPPAACSADTPSQSS